jgi:hypothetical protein
MSGIIVLTLLPYGYWHLVGIDPRYPPLIGLSLVGFGISIVMVLYLKGAISIVMVLYLKGGDFLCFLDRFITLEGERDYTRLPAAPESDASASAGAMH